MCSIESQSGVFTMEDSGPRSLLGTFSTSATSEITAWILGSCIDASFVELTAIRELVHRRKPMSIIEVRDQLVLF